MAQPVMLHDAAGNQPSLIAVVFEMIQIRVVSIHARGPVKNVTGLPCKQPQDAVMGGVADGKMAFQPEAFLREFVEVRQIGQVS